MGAAYRSDCYADAAAAAAAICAAEYPKSAVDASGAVVSFTCTVADPAHLAITSSLSAVTTVPVSFPTCDPAEHYIDGLEMFGLGVLVLLPIFLLKVGVADLFLSNH